MQWPCASGYHIPTSSEITSLINMGNSLWAWSSSASNFNTYMKMPLSWSRLAESAAVYSSWTFWYRWSSTNYNIENGYCLQRYYSTLRLRYVGKEDAKPIRPFKDAPVIPSGSGWNTLYSWSWGAWIFHNSSLWLISISSDWSNRLTIADKNLWATTVYNSWDTITSANSWYYYQWGNVYWFPWKDTAASSITKSSTDAKVNASSYWPWNYYSSSTYMIRSSSGGNYWDSSWNSDLRWWTTWVVMKQQEAESIFAWTTAIKSVYVGTTKVRPVLPSTYQEVEYIQSTWASWSGASRTWAYIDTWFKATSNTKVEFVAQMSANNLLEAYFWWRTWASNTQFLLFWRWDRWAWWEAYQYSYWNDAPFSWWSSPWASIANKNTFSIYRYDFYINWNRQSISGTAPSLTTAYNMYIFWLNNWGSLWWAANMKLWYFKVWENWTLVRNFVPCYRKSDSVIWLYDKVNNQFYTNSGSWSFTKWWNV